MIGRFAGLLDRRPDPAINRPSNRAAGMMLAKFLRSFPKGRFVQRLAVLSGGFAAGQVLMLISSPILTRLFTPAEFGVYAIFTALNGIFANVLSLRYELAVPAAPTERDAAGLTVLAFLVVVASCVLSLPAIWLGGEWLARVTEMPLLGWLLWFLPIAIVLHSAGETVSYWSVYRSTFRLNAVARVTQSAVQSALQVACGLLSSSPVGLVAGYILGCVARLAHLLAALPARDRQLFRDVSPATLLSLARLHWRYPAFSAPASLLEAGTQLLPALLLAALYGPAAAGWFSLGMRLMGLPIRLLSHAARQVFMGEAAQRDPRGIYRLFRRASLMFLGVGIAGMAPVIIAGPFLFALVFGEAWRPAGEMVQYLVPLYLTRFVVTPVSQTLNILGRQNLHLISSSVDALFLVATFAISWWFALPPLTAVLLFSLGSTLAYSLYFILAWRVARGHAASSASLEPARHEKADMLE